MSISNSGSNNSYDDELVQQLINRVDNLEATVEEQQRQIDEKDERIDELEATVEQQDDEIEELHKEIEQEKDRRSSEIEGCHSRISRVEANSEEITPTPEAERTTGQQPDLTPIEQLSRANDPSEVTDSPTVERAVSLFTNLPKWGSKTPKGIVLKPADNPLSLLEADRDESLAWKQYYRAAEALEQLSEGSVTFFDSDRHGKMIVLHEQSETFERVVNGTLTPSSVRAEG